MKFLKVLLIIVVIVLGVGLVLSLVIDGKYNFERSVVIDACAGDVQHHAFDFEHWQDWGPWNRSKATGEMHVADYEYFGDYMAVGSGYSWKGDSLGAGSITITSIEGDRMNYRLDFTEPYEDHSDGWLSVSPVEGGQQVTWGMAGELGAIPKIFMMFGPSMDEMVGTEFDRGLGYLKEMCEAMPKPDMTPAEQTMPEVHYIGKMYKGISTAELEGSSIHEEGFGAIMGHMAELGAEYGADFHPFARWHAFDMETNVGDMELGVPVSAAVEAGEGFTSGTMESCQAMVGTHMGSYDGVGEIWMGMEAYFGCNGMELGGFPYELYITDPGMQPDTALWQTDVVYPIPPPGAAHDADGHSHDDGDADHTHEDGDTAQDTDHEADGHSHEDGDEDHSHEDGDGAHEGEADGE